MTTLVEDLSAERIRLTSAAHALEESEKALRVERSRYLDRLNVLDKELTAARVAEKKAYDAEHVDRGEPHDFSDITVYGRVKTGGRACGLCGIERTEEIEPIGWNVCDRWSSHSRHRIIGMGGNYVTCDGLGHAPD